MAFFFNELLQLRRHFVKLDAEVGEFVFAVIQLLRYAGVKFACRKAVHAVFKDADGFGNVAGKDIRQQQADDEHAAEHDEFVPHGGNRQPRNHKGGQAFYARFVKIADEKQIFFAVGVKIDKRLVGRRVFKREVVGVFNLAGGNAAVEDVGTRAACDDVDVLRGGHLPALQQLARGLRALGLEGYQRVGEQGGFHVAGLLGVGFRQTVLDNPKGKAGNEYAADDDHAKSGEDALKEFHECALAGWFG